MATTMVRIVDEDAHLSPNLAYCSAIFLSYLGQDEYHRNPNSNDRW